MKNVYTNDGHYLGNEYVDLSGLQGDSAKAILQIIQLDETVDKFNEQANSIKSFKEQLEHYYRLAKNKGEKRLLETFVPDMTKVNDVCFYGFDIMIKCSKGKFRINQLVSIEDFIEWADGLTIDSEVIDKEESDSD